MIRRSRSPRTSSPMPAPIWTGSSPPHSTTETSPLSGTASRRSPPSKVMLRAITPTLISASSPRKTCSQKARKPSSKRVRGRKRRRKKRTHPPPSIERPSSPIFRKPSLTGSPDNSPGTTPSPVRQRPRPNSPPPPLSSSAKKQNMPGARRPTPPLSLQATSRAQQRQKIFLLTTARRPPS